MDELFVAYAGLPVLAQKWIKIGLFFLLAWIVGRFSRLLMHRILRPSRLSSRARPERLQTLRGLIAGIISMFALATAAFFSLGLFIEATTLLWMIGLFGAGFGLSARPIISDFMSGTSFIFEDTFSVGEKVEILEVEGIIEHITLRVTSLRAPSGELFTIPNGDIRLVRNFSRGRFSTANVTIKIPTTDLSRAIPLLEKLSVEAMDSLPNLIEPWQLISETGMAGQHAELTLLAKARFGQAAEMRPRLLALVQDTLSEAGLKLTD